MSATWTLRTERCTGDLAWLLAGHAELAREQGWDATFEAYVAEPLAACMLRAAVDERIVSELRHHYRILRGELG